jgi:predicted exporter
MLDLRELSPDAIPKRIGFGGRTQAKWVLMQDPSPLSPVARPELGMDSGPISLRFYARPKRMGS